MQSRVMLAGGRLRFISKSLAGRSLVRIVEEELIAVGIIDHQEPVAPPAFLDRSALAFEISPQRIEGRHRGLVGLRLDVQGDEHQPSAELLGPLAGKDERAALPLHLGDERLAVLLEAPGAREAETVHVEADRCVDIGHVEDGAGEPVGHRLEARSPRMKTTFFMRLEFYTPLMSSWLMRTQNRSSRSSRRDRTAGEHGMRR